MVTNHSSSVIVSATSNDEHNYFGTTILAIPITAAFLESLTEQQRAGLYTMTPLAGQKVAFLFIKPLHMLLWASPSFGPEQGRKEFNNEFCIIRVSAQLPNLKKIVGLLCHLIHG